MNVFSTLKVDLGERSYPIYIGANLIADSTLIGKHISGRKVMIVTNEFVAPIYLDAMRAALADFETDVVVLPDGESHKTLNTVNLIFDKLLEQRFDRNCTLVALGGGVIGDITGFAAASYQRGVNFVQVPTTLLAQVDSSVGGKTGVNHRLGKNMIGAFHQPRCVIADTKTLSTLSDAELSAGLAEVIKYGAIDSPDFFNWVEANIDALKSRDASALSYAIEQSCAHKARIVAADERESGQRALLNLGHTFGHAIETASGYGNWLHGQAVGAGMCMAARFSESLGWMRSDETQRLGALVRAANLPTNPPEAMRASQFMELMSVDKKVRDGVLKLVLMRGIGQSVVTADYERDALMQFLESDCAVAA
ncbi:MAG: 3-dehydroquinate synthase [Pseudomonadota bacterium]